MPGKARDGKATRRHEWNRNAMGSPLVLSGMQTTSTSFRQRSVANSPASAWRFVLCALPFALACAKHDTAQSPADSSRPASTPARSALHCPPPAVALLHTLAGYTPPPDQSAYSATERPLPREWGAIALGMTGGEFTTLTGVPPQPCKDVDCARHHLGPHSSSALFTVEAGASGPAYRPLASDSAPNCAVELLAAFFRDTLVTIEEIRRAPWARDSLIEKYTVLFGAPAVTDSDSTSRTESWSRDPTVVRLRLASAPLAPAAKGAPAPGAILSVTLNDPGPQQADYMQAVNASIRRADSIVHADSIPPSPTWPLPRGWASITLGMTESAFALAVGADPKDCSKEDWCPDGGTSSYVLVDSTAGMIIFREPSKTENSTANRSLAAQFFGRRLYMLVLRTRYAAAVQGAPSPYDSLRRQALKDYGPPSDVLNAADASFVSWNKGPGQYWIRRTRSPDTDEVTVGWLDCRLAGPPDGRCPRFSGKTNTP